MSLQSDIREEIAELKKKKELLEIMQFSIANGFEVSAIPFSMEFEISMIFSDPLYAKDLVFGALNMWEIKNRRG